MLLTTIMSTLPTHIPPGFIFLASFSPKLLTAAALVVFTNRYTPFRISSATWAAFFVGFIPVYAIAKSTIRSFGRARECRRLGARMPPFVHRTVYTLGIDIIWRVTRSFLSGYIADAVPEWEKEYGYTVGFDIFGDYVLTTSEPNFVKAILATDFDSFEKGEVFRRDYQSVLGTGVFNSDGEMWKFHRAMTRPFFARDRVTDFDLFDRHTNLAISKMKERFSEGEPVDFQDVISRFTLDSATEFLFGSCVNSLSAPLPYAWNSSKAGHVDKQHPSDIFAKAFNDAQVISSRRSRLMDFWYLAEFFKDQTRKPMSIIYEYIDPVLEEALARKSSGVTSHDSFSAAEETKPETLLDHLLQEVTDFKVIRDEIVNIMIAGRDTTMATITFAMYCLSQHPEILETLRKEILSVVGSSQRPTQDDLKACKYLRAVINETLRLYPAVPFNLRRSKRHTTFPARDGGKPYFVPADTDVSYSVWIMHRREDLWGPDASKFDPSRFLDERLHKYLTPNPFIFLPFNAGPRICLGQQFAYNEVSFILIRLLQEFESIEMDFDAQPPDSKPPASWRNTQGTKGTDKIWPKSHLTVYSYKGVWMRMKETKDKLA